MVFLTHGQVSHALIRSTGNGLCNQKPVTRVQYQPHSGVNVQLAPDLVGDLRDVIQFMILSMLGKSLRSDRQMAGKVGQVDCREKLDGIGIWICRRSFELLKDRCIIFPVTQTGEYCEAEMPIGGSDLESAHCLFQLSLKCRLPFRILALPHRL